MGEDDSREVSWYIFTMISQGSDEVGQGTPVMNRDCLVCGNTFLGYHNETSEGPMERLLLKLRSFGRRKEAWDCLLSYRLWFLWTSSGHYSLVYCMMIFPRLIDFYSLQVLLYVLSRLYYIKTKSSSMVSVSMVPYSIFYGEDKPK